MFILKPDTHEAFSVFWFQPEWKLADPICTFVNAKNYTRIKLVKIIVDFDKGFIARRKTVKTKYLYMHYI